MKLTGLILALSLTAGMAAAQDATTDTETDAASDASATSQDLANGTTFGDWLVACEAISVRDTACRLVQTLTLTDGQTLVSNFITVPSEDGAILIAQVPMGVYLPGGAVYRFAGDEDAEQREMIWQSCQGQVCEAAAPLDAEELAAMDAAGKLLFGYRIRPDADPVVVEVDVTELSEGLDALRAEPLRHERAVVAVVVERVVVERVAHVVVVRRDHVALLGVVRVRDLLLRDQAHPLRAARAVLDEHRRRAVGLAQRVEPERAGLAPEDIVLDPNIDRKSVV